jgi:thiol-disulfide isomerase/thioredoxin
MYPFERSLVRKYKDKQFTIIGVNSDEKEDLAELFDNRTIKWPCFWDGGSPGGPIAQKWQVFSWPTIYIIDEKGVIRFKPRGDQEIDDDIYLLLNELKTKTPAAPTAAPSPVSNPVSNPAPSPAPTATP